MPMHLRLMYLNLWCIGLRVNEVCTLKGDAYYWKDDTAWVKIYQNKMRSEKTVPIPSVLYRLMRDYIEKNHIQPDEYIFKGAKGQAYHVGTFAKQMIENGGGSIINFASMNTYCPLTRNFAYAMSKAAVANFTQSFAAYFANTGVRINAVAPGFIVNERSVKILGTVESGLTERGTKVIAHTPMGKFGQAQDMFGCVKFLLDDRASSFVTGVTIPVDGGFLTLSGV